MVAAKIAVIYSSTYGHIRVSNTSAFIVWHSVLGETMGRDRNVLRGERAPRGLVNMRGKRMQRVQRRYRSAGLHYMQVTVLGSSSVGRRALAWGPDQPRFC